MSEAAEQREPARSCFCKTRYADEQEALGVAAHCFAVRGALLRVYQCELCGGFHLTKRDVPSPKPGWRPPEKSQRQQAAERRRARRRR